MNPSPAPEPNPDKVRWAKLNQLFHAALELDSSERDAFLKQSCGDDRALYTQLSRMVQDSSSAGLLDVPPVPPPQPAGVFSAGDIVAGRYRIVRLVGQGGMGEVYEAHDAELNERVALKTLLPEIAGDARMLSRFKQEIQLSRKIGHPNVCRVFDLSRHPSGPTGGGGVYFLTMNFLDGETLSDKLRDGPMSADTALPLIENMAGALDAAHAAGVLHRDLKPSNIMLVSGEPGLRAVVTDFGLARSFTKDENTGTHSSNLMGTFDYMAPEIFRGASPSPASDLYALGLIVWKMVTGALPPPPGASKTPATKLPSTWTPALARALDPDPLRRFETAADFVNALRGNMTVRLPALTRRRTIALAAALGIATAAPFAWFAVKRQLDRPPAAAMALYQKGVDHIQAGAYFAATKALTEATRLAPNYPLAHARLAEAWNALEIPEKAKTEMLVALRADGSGSSTSERLLIDAIDLTIVRDFPAAASKYEVISRNSGPTSDIDLGRAYEHLDKGDARDAAVPYLRAASASPPNPAAWLRLAVLFSWRNQLPESANAFRKAEEYYDNNQEGLIEVMRQRGVAETRLHKYPEAQADLERALEGARTAGKVQQEVNAELDLATVAYLRGDANLVEQLAKQAIDTARVHQMDFLSIRGLINLANAYRTKSEFSAAEKYYGDALLAARAESQHKMIAISQLSLATLHMSQKKTDLVIPEAQEALEYFKTNKYDDETSQSLTLLARSHRDRGEFQEALANLQEMLARAERSEKKSSLAAVHTEIGSLYRTQERLPDALEHYRQALSLNLDDASRGYSFLQCADVLWQLGRYDEAVAMFKSGDLLAREIPDLSLKIGRSKAQMELAFSHSREALSAANESLAKVAPVNKGAIVELEGLIGLAMIANGNREEGRRKCEAALATASGSGSTNLEITSSVAAVEAREATGYHRAAAALYSTIKPKLADRPLTRFRTLALLSGSDLALRVQAIQTIREVQTLLGETAYKTYLDRPDISRLARPLLSADPANHK